MAAGMSRAAPVAQEGRTAGRYAAFISYSHADEEFGDWLHKRLESYRVPSPLVGRAGLGGAIRKRLGRAFRDRVELSAAHDLGAEIRRALEQAETLIVLCSPRSCRSRYVAEEIATFKRLGKGDRIFAAIIDGEPHAAGKPGRTGADECFPPALIYRLDANGALTHEPEAEEPIAADFRDGKDGRENGSLKLIAGMLGVGLDELVQREKQAERRRRLRSNAVALAMSVLAIGAFAGGGLAWWQQQVARSNEQRAIVGERLAQENASEAARQRDAAVAARDREIAERNRADYNAQQAQIQELLAREGERDALNALARIFGERSWQAMARDEYSLAARYALAGLRVAAG